MEASKKTEWPQISKKDWHEEAVLDHTTCCLCGSELRFQHKVDHIRQHATEEANCPSCGVKHRSTEHRLQ